VIKGQSTTFDNTSSLERALRKGSSRSHTVQAAFDQDKAERFKEMLHRRAQESDKSTSMWTLELAAEVSFGEGLTNERVSGETVRATLARLGVRWQRAKRWITSPDLEYSRKKGGATV
jgi:hypothetical protein